MLNVFFAASFSSHSQQLHEIVIWLKEPWFYLFIGSLVSRIMDDKYMIISPSGNYKNQLHFK